MQLGYTWGILCKFLCNTCGYLSKTLISNARSPTKVESVTVSWQVDATGLYVDSTAYPSITGSSRKCSLHGINGHAWLVILCFHHFSHIFGFRVWRLRMSWQTTWVSVQLPVMKIRAATPSPSMLPPGAVTWRSAKRWGSQGRLRDTHLGPTPQ